MDKLVILFTMEGCPYCVQMKEQLTESNISFVERDIRKYEEEYEMFVEITENEFVPAFMIVESPDTIRVIYLHRKEIITRLKKVLPSSKNILENKKPPIKWGFLFKIKSGLSFYL